MEPIIETDLPNLFFRGKVRDGYDLGDDKLLIVATDRISVYLVLSSFDDSGSAQLLPNVM